MSCKDDKPDKVNVMAELRALIADCAKLTRFLKGLATHEKLIKLAANDNPPEPPRAA